MNKIFDALEICLQEMKNGADIEIVLARFPDLANELRPILETSRKAESFSASEPSAEAVRRGRAKLMQRAAEMRESKAAPRKRVIPAFQRFALSFTMVAALLLSSTGLVNASSSALPGESLYPVKRTWEGLRLFLIFNKEARNLLESQYKSERLQEVNELLLEGRHETIQFAGVFMDINGLTYISGIQVILPANNQVPLNGAAVIVTGQTNPQGVVEIISIELLPQGSVVPVGNPVIMESETGESGSLPNSNPGSFGTEPEAQPQYYEMEGTLQSISTTTLVINDLTVYSSDTQIEGQLCIGFSVEVKGYYDQDGNFIATEAKGEDSCNSGGGQGEGSGGNSGNDNGQNSNSNDNANTNENNSNDSGGGNDNNSGSNDNSSDDNGGGDTNDGSDD